MTNIADFVMRSLRLSGIDVLFGYPGQSNLALLHAAQAAGLRYVQTSDERAAGFAAMGYALASQRLGAVCVSKGPAATNLLTPLLSAMKDGVPLLIVTGNVARGCRGRNGFQEFDVCQAFLQAGAVKLARYCDNPTTLCEALTAAIGAAANAPFGPAVVDIPYDFSGDSCSAPPLRVAPVHGAEVPVAAAWTDGADAAVAPLAAAQRPVLIVGAGARRDYMRVRAFAAVYDCPVVHTMGGTGVIASSHSLYRGLLRHNGSPLAARAVHEADVILALGTGLDERATGERSGFARTATKIQVDVDAGVLERNDLVEIRIHTTIREFLRTISGRLPARVSHAGWLETLSAPDFGRSVPQTTGQLSARDVIRVASAALAGAIVVKDSGSHKYWMTNLAPCSDPTQSIASCHFGTMGFALPAAIGASIGNPHRKVIAACGDGGVLMALPELITAAREACANLKVLVFNNAGLGSTRDYERRVHPEAACISDFRDRLRLADYARAMGIASHSIAGLADLDRLPQVLADPGLALIDCLTDPAERLSPAVSYLGPLARLADQYSESLTA